MGIFSFLFGEKLAPNIPTNIFRETKREDGVVTYETESKKVVETGGIAIMSSFVINKDEETAALGRQATVLKNEKDWDGAIACLHAQQARMKNFPGHSINTWCRLGLVLQQAGSMDEANKEFQRRLDDLPRLARQLSFLDNPEIFPAKGKKANYNRIIKTYTKVIEENWELARQREERRLVMLMKNSKAA